MQLSMVRFVGGGVQLATRFGSRRCASVSVGEAVDRIEATATGVVISIEGRADQWVPLSMCQVGDVADKGAKK